MCPPGKPIIPMPKFTYFLLLLCFSSAMTGQATFHKNYQSGVNYVFTNDLLAISDGDFLVCGQHQNFEGGTLTKISASGAVIWNKIYNSLFTFTSLAEIDGGYVALGYRKGPPPLSQVNGVICKISPNGEVLWSKQFDFTYYYSTTKLLRVPGGFVFSGQQTYQINNTYQSFTIVAKADNDGNIIWNKSFISDFTNNSFTPQLVMGNVLLASGNIMGNGAMVRLDLTTGDFLGATSLGGLYLENFSDMAPTSDGNFLLAGNTFSPGESEYSLPWVIKISPAGQIFWSKIYRLDGISLMCRMTKSPNGNFVLSTQGGFYDILLEIDENGQQIWAKNYAVGQSSNFGVIQPTIDMGLITLGFNNGIMLMKCDAAGKIANGCCPANVNFTIENFNPPLKQYAFTVSDISQFTASTNVEAGVGTTPIVSDYCQIPQTSLNFQYSICKEDSIDINGVYYHAPAVVRDTLISNSGGCDTIRVYTISQAPEPFLVKTIRFCPGTSVNINGTEYTQPGTVTQILPNPNGCDTLLAYILQHTFLPIRFDSTYFCQGDTVWFHGVPYLYPNVVVDTLPGAGNDCDTVLYHHLFWLNFQPSTVSIQCPADIQVNSAVPVPVMYPAPTATSDCPCPNITVAQEQGLPSGAQFPLGTTTLCYRSTDACYQSASCCFTVTVSAENACDFKENGCLRFELLKISTDQQLNRTYRVRVTNHCAQPLVYTALELPNAVEAVSPAQASTYTSPNSRNYDVRNPAYLPFRSVRFKSANPGIANGQSDIFEYTLPAQANPIFLQVGGKTASGVWYQSTLNTFGCTVQAEDRALATENRRLAVFPNPSLGQITVDVSDWKSGAITLTIQNARGETVASYHLPGGSNLETIDLSTALANGLYWMTVQDESGAKTSSRFTLMR